MPDGSDMCEPCQIETVENKILKTTPNSDSAKRILRERAIKHQIEMQKEKRELEIRFIRPR
jgi:hypothetical protein